jgi:RNA polymerase sigma-70 factor (ECF subfamily)
MSAAPRLTRPGESDAELLVAVAAGDLPALGELFDRHEPALRRYLSRMGIPRADVDDLVQATFLEITRAAPSFDARHSGRSWIFGVASIMLRRHRHFLRRAAARISAWVMPEAAAEDTPAELFERAEAERRFARAFAALSEKKREAFVLVTLEGLSGEEAAKALGVPVNTIWTRLHHARVELSAAIEEKEHEKEDEEES